MRSHFRWRSVSSSMPLSTWSRYLCTILVLFFLVWILCLTKIYICHARGNEAIMFRADSSAISINSTTELKVDPARIESKRAKESGHVLACSAVSQFRHPTQINWVYIHIYFEFVSNRKSAMSPHARRSFRNNPWNGGASAAFNWADNWIAHTRTELWVSFKSFRMVRVLHARATTVCVVTQATAATT